MFSIYATCISVGCIYSLIVPIVFIEDTYVLLKQLYKYFEIWFNVRLDTYIPPLWSVYLAVQTMTLMTLLMTTCKWLKHPVQLLPAIYYCSNLLARKNGGFGETEFSINSYRAIYIFIGVFNEVFSLPLISLKSLMIVFPSIGISQCIVDQPSLMYIPLIIESVGMIFFVNTSFIFASTVFEFSTNFVTNLKLISYILPGNGAGIMNRKVASLRRCRISCGSLYYVDRPVVLQINDAILNYTISNIMFMKKLR